ncbi:DEAD/DEAH box helicase, partial [Methanocaldococcus sp.]
MELRDYQKEAVEVFLKYKRGIISLPTGTGKTIIALEVIKRLNANRVLIIVPTKLLKEQWAKIVKEKLNYYPLTMKAKPPYEKVAHIVTYSYLRRTPDALTFINPELIICDEAHHLGAENTFKKVTTKLASLDIPILMLTATPLTSAPYSNELIKLFPIIYDRGYNDLKEFIPKVKLILVPFLLTTKEKLLYNEYSRELAKISS